MESTPFSPGSLRSEWTESPGVTIDGLQPSIIVRPETPQEVADGLAEAEAREHAVAPVGGGTALTLGNLPERLDVALSLERLTGILAYEPTDLTLSVAAGTRFAEIQAVLAEHGQTLPIDVPDPERATIGGLVATGLAGPRRYGHGTLRDLLIGISVAHPSGMVSKAGGMVVKNVTGFDLMRVYHGSLGTLAVIVSANFKVLPLARFESTVLAPFASLDEAVAASVCVRGSRVQPAALEITNTAGQWWLAVRIEGRESTVRLLARECREVMRAEAQVLEASQSADWWRGYIASESLAAREGVALVRAGVVPKQTGALLAQALELAEASSVRVDLVHASPGLGAVLLGMRVADDSRSVEQFHRWRSALMAIADTVTVLSAPVTLKRGIDVWGAPPQTLDLMRSLKAEFDPKRVLNPGRFAGGL